ncbi:tigger transposable element-derived protein 4-like [Schistocerca serialis cubense]|uniref:tigger transposable element-derived protein 4-like n=1 Tax=Schistocerca serialis cubense TaxID=2023355 RepID=UPI00214EB2DE|nr:tigger transposable element-derived protein 4-like [Schistocerca serialis cubense]
MTPIFFEAEIRSWDRELRSQKRKILVHVNNCPEHPALSGLENIKLVFLPGYMTSVLQPVDQELIRSLKCQCRKLILLKMIQCTEKKQDYSTSLLSAIRYITKTWSRVKAQTFKKGFRHGKGTTEGVNAAKIEDTFDDTDDLPLSDLLPEISCDNLSRRVFEMYATIDDYLVTTEVQTEEIANEVKNQGHSDHDVSEGDAVVDEEEWN